MGSFFQNMNLTRFIILLSLLGSIVLAYVAWGAESRLDELKTALDRQVPLLVGEIQQRSHRHTELVKTVEGEGFKGVSEAGAYIRRIAEGDDLQLGNVSIDERDVQVARNIKDRTFRIRPADRNRSFSRDQIATFLYKLEQGSQRVKVTDIAVEIAKEKGSKTVQPEDIPADRWTFDTTITVRQEDSGNSR